MKFRIMNAVQFGNGIVKNSIMRTTLVIVFIIGLSGIASGNRSENVSEKSPIIGALKAGNPFQCGIKPLDILALNGPVLSHAALTSEQNNPIRLSGDTVKTSDGRNFNQNNTTGVSDWLFSEDWLSNVSLLDLKGLQQYLQPSYYPGPHRYTGFYDNCITLTNSGVWDFAFYLLFEGRPGNNDGHTYDISDIGINNAGKVYRYANLFLLTKNSRFQEGPDAWVNVAPTPALSAVENQTVGDARVVSEVLKLAKNLTVSLTGEGVIGTEITVSPEFLKEVILGVDTKDATLTINNPGDSVLDYRITAVENTYATARIIPTREKYDASQFVTIPKGARDTRVGNPVTRASGGPDAFGYRWKDSDESGGPLYVWNDISGTGTYVSLSDDDYEQVQLNFTFPFYENTYTSIFIGSNGYITLGTGSYTLSNSPIPSISTPNNLISALWDDLNPSAGGTVFFQSFSNYAVVQFDGVPHYVGGGNYTFQMVLHESGTVQYYYNTMTGTLTSSTVGIEDITGTDGLEVAYNTAYIHDGLAVEFNLNPGWISFSPESGTVAAGGSSPVTVTFNSTGLLAGDYYGDILINHNVPSDPNPLAIPCTLTVNPWKSLIAEPATCNFGQVWALDDSLIEVTLSNTGNEVTIVSGISINNGEFTHDIPTIPFTIPAFGEVSFNLLFAPIDLGVETGTMTITSDADDNPSISITLTGVGTAGPEITATPVFFKETINGGDTIYRTLEVGNTGAADLEFSARTETYALLLKGINRPERVFVAEKNNNTVTRNTGTTAGKFKNKVELFPNFSTRATDLSVLYVTTIVATGGTDNFVTGLQGLGNVSNLEVLNCQASTPDVSYLQNYDIVVVGSYSSWADAVLLGNNLAEYVDLGGKVVLMGGPIYSGQSELTGSNIIGPAYSPLSVATLSLSIINSESFVPHQITDGVDTIFGAYGLQTTTQGSGVSLGLYAGGYVIAAYNPDKPVVAINIFPYNTYWGGDLILMMGNTFDWLTESWLKVDPAGQAIIVGSGSSTTLDVIFNSTGLLAGDYFGDVLLDHNAPSALNPFAIPCTLTVNPWKSLIAEPATFDFGQEFVGDKDTVTITIKNTGNNITTVSAVTINNAVFTHDISVLPLTVPAFGEDSFNVIFAPVNAGVETGIVTITSDANDNPSLAVSLTGEGVTKPEIIVSPEFLKEFIIGEDTKDATLTINNPGGSVLSYSISFAENIYGYRATRVLSAREKYDASYFVNIPKGAPDTRVGNPVTRASGGPDVFGYVWKDSDHQGGPVYVWNDISATGTALTLSDESFAEVTLPDFTFSYYGNDYTSIFVGSNGYITLGAGSSFLGNLSIPDTLLPNNIISGFWDDLDPSSGGSVYFQSLPDYAVVQFDQVPEYGGPGTYTFQMVLHKSGKIIFYYNSMSGELHEATIGIENSDGRDGLEVAFNTSYIKNNLAVEFLPRPGWISSSPDVGTVATGGSSPVTVTLNSAGLALGLYTCKLRIFHDGNNTSSPLGVPCTLVVTDLVPTYTVNVTPSGNGTVIPDGDATVGHGQPLAISANANANHHFVNWEVTGGGLTLDDENNAATNILNVTNNGSVVAHFAINQYTVTVASGGNGTVQPDGDTLIDHGSGLDIVATPATGYDFDSWDITGGLTLADPNSPSTTINNITATGTATAVFVLKSYSIDIEVTGNGTVTPSSPQLVLHASDLLIVATADTDWYFDHWTVSLGLTLEDPYNFSTKLLNVISAGTVTAIFSEGTLPDYTVNVSSSGNGSVVPDGDTTVVHGNDLDIEATPSSPEYNFVNWTVTGGLTVADVNNPTTQVLNVTGDGTVTANFTITTYTVTFKAGSHGIITGTQIQTVAHGSSSSQVTAVPDANYHFTGWTGSYTGTNNPLTVTNVTTDLTITANFAVNTHIVTFVAGPNGSITGTLVQTVAHGSDCTPVTAVPTTGYQFTGWSGGYAGPDNPLTITNVTTDLTITANFAVNTHIVTFVAGPNGGITGTLVQTVAHGSDCTPVTAVPTTGYQFTGWSGDNTGTDNPLYVINVTSDLTMTANFAINQYTITVTASTGGTITPVGPVTVDHGASSPAFQIVPSTGYKIVDVAINGQPIGLVATYTFVNVISNNTLSGTFDLETSVDLENVNGPTFPFSAAPIPANLIGDKIYFTFNTTEKLDATLTVYDNLGNTLMKTEHQFHARKDPKNHDVFATWDLTDNQGKKVTSGTYAAILVVKNNEGSTKMYKLIIGVKE